MLAKCANRLCNTPFRRLSEGKLFLLQGDAGPAGEPLDPRKPKPPRRLEYFWLCSGCARLVTLTFNSNTGVTAVPLPTAKVSAPLQGSTHAPVASEAVSGLHMLLATTTSKLL
ncbi:MAG TPA: hypothetical protein VMT53_01520 [Terriglobales bacterium]|nr:hypothetical protein [Terriglobales bacterium]